MSIEENLMQLIKKMKAERDSLNTKTLEILKKLGEIKEQTHVYRLCLRVLNELDPKLHALHPLNDDELITIDFNTVAIAVENTLRGLSSEDVKKEFTAHYPSIRNSKYIDVMKMHEQLRKYWETKIVEIEKDCDKPRLEAELNRLSARVREIDNELLKLREKINELLET